MRDPAMIKTLLKQPEYRKMLEQSFEQMNTGQMDPQMMAAMQQGMNGNPAWQNQFDQVRLQAHPPSVPLICALLLPSAARRGDGRRAVCA
jgi:hypothetical protein